MPKASLTMLEDAWSPESKIGWKKWHTLSLPYHIQRYSLIMDIWESLYEEEYRKHFLQKLLSCLVNQKLSLGQCLIFFRGCTLRGPPLIHTNCSAIFKLILAQNFCPYTIQELFCLTFSKTFFPIFTSWFCGRALFFSMHIFSLHFLPNLVLANSHPPALVYHETATNV